MEPKIAGDILLQSNWQQSKSDCLILLLKEAKEMDYKNPFEFYAVLQKYDTPNRNGRSYPEKILKREANNYSKIIAKGLSTSELNHPESSLIDLDRVSHIITEIWWDKNILMGKLKLLTSPGFHEIGVVSTKGDLAANLLRQGVTLGMNPDKIMEFVEENCSVEVNFTRSNTQSVKIKGFDFAPQRHIARGGVVSSEWTAQMVVSYKIMEEFYLKKGDKIKAASYGKKARMYLSELGNMIISSSSASGQGEGCLPYATQDQVDTGHGWMTPKGSYTGSVSGTAYALFAYYGFNPLELIDHQE